MGCISSKVLFRSLSTRETTTTTPTACRRRPPLTWEELLSSDSNGKDKLFSLVNFTPPPPPPTTTTPNPHPPLIHHHHDVCDNNNLAAGVAVAGSRSFHTVEEYDALLYRIHNDVSAEPQTEKGQKRRGAAKSLKSLDLHFPAPLPTLKQHLYLTPKFGSYNLNDDNNKPEEDEESHSDDAVFSPQLVAAFEHRMLQLKQDEDDILKHIHHH